jgi:N-acetylmuramoyl-L-alanine amidase
MVKIEDQLLTLNEYSRGGKKILPLKAVVIHWTGNPNSTAQGDRNFFENRKNGKDGYGSAHYIIQDTTVIRCIPDNEVAYHCGTSQLDPASGKLYTDYARQKFGQYATDTVHLSPNMITIGLELHPIDGLGTFTGATLASAAEITARLLKDNKLTLEDITTHNAIVGWKSCPKLWVDRPEELEKFKNLVKTFMI